MFGQRGFHAATIEQIADEAGPSNGAIYSNFENKGDLFFALLEERQEERIRHMRRALTGNAAVGAGDIGRAAEARDATRSLKDSREWRLLLLEFIAHAARIRTLAPKLRSHKRRFRAALAELLERRLAERRVASPFPPEQLALGRDRSGRRPRVRRALRPRVRARRATR